MAVFLSFGQGFEIWEVLNGRFSEWAISLSTMTSWVWIRKYSERTLRDFIDRGKQSDLNSIDKFFRIASKASGKPFLRSNRVYYINK